jgi:hydroxypyruvate reductase
VAAARAVFGAAVAAVRPDRLLDTCDLNALLPGGRVRLLAVGKAALGLAGAAEARLGERTAEGLAVLPRGYLASVPVDLPLPQRSAVLEAGHPVPDAASVEAGRAALALAGRAAADGHSLLVLLSGGGSALLEFPAPGLELDDLRQTNRLLLRAGVPIGGVNAVRKHLSALKGGRLAAAAHPAPVAALVLSDVVGDDLAVIASGPTVADPSTFADALRVLDEAGVREAVPQAVRRHLEAGAAGEREETPKPGDRRLARAATRLLGTNADALEGARREAERRGYRVEVRARDVTGEARAVGARLAAALRAVPEARVGLLWAGEPTVTVMGEGRGGRCQEAALAAALALDGAPQPLTVLAAGTDGVDGPTDAAGAVVTERTLASVRAAGLDPAAALAAHDSHGCFQAAGPHLPPGEGLVVTGPTHTNVMDVFVGLVG